MTEFEFLKNFQDVLQTEDDISMETILADLDEWDSLAVMSTMAFLEGSFNVKTSMADYRNMVTVADVAKKAGI